MKIIKFVKNKIINFIRNQIKAVNQEKNLEDYIDMEVKRSSAKLILKKGTKCISFKSKIELYNFIVEENLIKQSFLEFGVWKGDSISFFAKRYPDLHFFGFDSFEGLPQDWRTGFKKGTFDTNKVTPPMFSNVKYIEGWFNDSIPSFLAENDLTGPIFMHIDCDLYSSTVDVFNALGNHISVGMYILFDEFINYPGWELHEYKALMEFLNLRKLDFEIIAVNVNHEQVLIRII